MHVVMTSQEANKTVIRPHKMHSHPRLLVLSIVPAVAGLWDQQGDYIVLREAEQGAVVTGCMGEDGLDPSSAVSLQPGGHGAGPGQRTGLRWNTGWILVSTFSTKHCRKTTL